MTARSTNIIRVAALSILGVPALAEIGEMRAQAQQPFPMGTKSESLGMPLAAVNPQKPVNDDKTGETAAAGISTLLLLWMLLGGRKSEEQQNAHSVETHLGDVSQNDPFAEIHLGDGPSEEHLGDTPPIEDYPDVEIIEKGFDETVFGPNGDVQE